MDTAYYPQKYTPKEKSLKYDAVNTDFARRIIKYWIQFFIENPKIQFVDLKQQSKYKIINPDDGKATDKKKSQLTTWIFISWLNYLNDSMLNMQLGTAFACQTVLASRLVQNVQKHYTAEIDKRMNTPHIE